MIEQFRRFMTTVAGRILSIVVSVALVGVAVYAVSQFLKGDTPEDSFYQTYVCSETGKSFRHKNVFGEKWPILSPYSGKETGYPAEACNWNKDGTVKSEPTWVLLNANIGKPEPTFCPDCGRLVVERNPTAVAGQRPPPTREEWFARHQH